MKIMFVSTGLGLGGAERQVVDLADRMVEKGHEVTLVCLTGNIMVRPECQGISILHLGMTKSPYSLFKCLIKLVQHIRRNNPDVVHGHMVHANLLARLAKCFVSIPVLVSTAHSCNEGSWHRMWAYRVTNSLCDVFTNVGSVAVKAFEVAKAAEPGRIISIPNGIDTERFYPDHTAYDQLRVSEDIPGDRKIFLAVGRFVEAKDYPNLLNAFAIVRDQRPECELWIVGGGPLTEHVQSLSDSLRLQNSVKFMGVRHDIPDLMRMADLYVLSSRWEGMPLVVGEAMASGLLVVATDCGGVLEYVGDTTFLAPVANHQALADRLLYAASMTPSQLDDAGRRARQIIVTRFSLDAIVDKWLAIYHSVLRS